MKHLLTAIACCLAVAGSAQFIMQPMNYNPDSNSDDFIGSEDLVGLLSLYGTPFDSGDSLNVVTLDFTGQEFDTLQIPSSADIVYLLSGGQTGQPSERYYLLPPQIPAHKSLLVIPVNNFEGFADWCNFHALTESEEWGTYELYSLSIESTIMNSQMGIFVRDHFGNWRTTRTLWP